MNPHDEDVVAPSLDFGSEAEVVDDWSYVEKCRAMADKLVVGLNCRLGESLLTKEENWGLVWRGISPAPIMIFLRSSIELFAGRRPAKT